MNGQLNLCLMAAEMFRAPLEISLPFPQVRQKQYVTLKLLSDFLFAVYISDERIANSHYSLKLDNEASSFFLMSIFFSPQMATRHTPTPCQDRQQYKPLRYYSEDLMMTPMYYPPPELRECTHHHTPNCARPNASPSRPTLVDFSLIPGQR